MQDNKYQNVEQLKAAGYMGFEPLGRLMRENILPDVPGVFVVVRPDMSGSRFIDIGSAPKYKGQDPNVSIVSLLVRWIKDAQTVYIGKAGKSLHNSVMQLMEFGSGVAVDHWDGRFLWQITNIRSYLLAWRPLPKADVDAEQQKAFEEFRQLYGKLPFANNN